MVRKMFLPLLALVLAVGLLFFLRQTPEIDQAKPGPVVSEAEKPVGVAETQASAPTITAETEPLPIDETALGVKDLRRQGRYVLGVVTDPHGTPVPRARIQAVPGDGGPPYNAVGKDDGSFYVMAPANVAHTLVIEVAGVPALEVDAP